MKRGKFFPSCHFRIVNAEYGSASQDITIRLRDGKLNQDLLTDLVHSEYFVGQPFNRFAQCSQLAFWKAPFSDDTPLDYDCEHGKSLFLMSHGGGEKESNKTLLERMNRCYELRLYKRRLFQL
jgi:hypothetical protein